jgi:xanthine dehydrogenase YagT iron-sulfur-binding subunit
MSDTPVSVVGGCPPDQDSGAPVGPGLAAPAPTAQTPACTVDGNASHGAQSSGTLPELAARLSRRSFIQSTSLFAGSLALPLSAHAQDGQEARTAEPSPPVAPSSATRVVNLTINGRPYSLQIESRVTLLDALREYLQLTGTKKGCDRGQCGACTVLIDGRRVNSCLTLAVMGEGHAITTIEGIGRSGTLHPVQAAFIDHDALQCGYCTPGQICSAIAMLEELRGGSCSTVTPDVRMVPVLPSADEIRERMSGNLCRCGAYTQIAAALLEVAQNPSVPGLTQTDVGSAMHG